MFHDTINFLKAIIKSWINVMKIDFACISKEQSYRNNVLCIINIYHS